MRPATVLALLALAALCLAGLAAPPSLPFCSTAFISKREGSEVVRRLRRYLDSGLGAPAPYPDPLEPKREVCELNPNCDELADHIGFQDRAYTPVSWRVTVRIQGDSAGTVLAHRSHTP
uniref:Osteocalcin n=1 Tax=Ursus maritimus TaxID=29073 RepID=A0A452UVP3_URSMA